MTEKLIKEFEKIRASLTKSKKLILADIDKIDEKYRRLAQEEKKHLTDNLSVLNEQLKFYDSMCSSPSEYLPSEAADDAPVEEPKEEVEEKIQDTIFPENNVPDEEDKKEVEDEKNAEDLNDAIQQEKEEALEQEMIVAEADAQQDGANEETFEQSDTQQDGDPNQWPEYEGKEEVPVQTTTDDWSDIDEWK